MASGMRAPRMPEYNLSSFTVLDTVGEGSYGEVLHVQRRSDDQEFALKVMNKQFIIREGKVDAIKGEREVLDKLQHPGIVELHFTFQDSESLYMALTLCRGDLFSLIKRRSALTHVEARFYCAELAMVIEFMHANDVIHCDIKPENVLLSNAGHVKLCDFGCATLVGEAKAPVDPAPHERPNRLRGRGRNVGTAEYMPPEVIVDTKISFAVDWWALGCVLFQCLVGRPPFRGATEYLTFEAVLAHSLSFDGAPEPPSESARALVEELLEVDPERRLGAGSGGSAAVRAHDFFTGVDWESIFLTDPPRAPSPTPEAASPESVAQEQDGAGDDGRRGGAEEAGPPEVAWEQDEQEAMGLFAKRKQGLLSQDGRLVASTTGRVLFKLITGATQYLGDLPIRSVSDAQAEGSGARAAASASSIGGLVLLRDGAGGVFMFEPVPGEPAGALESLMQVLSPQATSSVVGSDDGSDSGRGGAAAAAVKGSSCFGGSPPLPPPSPNDRRREEHLPLI